MGGPSRGRDARQVWAMGNYGGCCGPEKVRYAFPGLRRQEVILDSYHVRGQGPCNMLYELSTGVGTHQA
eukprot:scaffold15804_cov60-Phaeocystis_antarctica.AAC.5